MCIYMDMGGLEDCRCGRCVVVFAISAMHAPDFIFGYSPSASIEFESMYGYLSKNVNRLAVL